MASRNNKIPTIKTHEGGKAKNVSLSAQLRRSVMACMLWESTFYEDGEEIAHRIADLCQKVDKETVKKLAIEAKYDMGIRHTPLFMAVSAGIFEKDFIKKLIRRPDDMTELLSLYWASGKKALPKQLKLALAEKFNEFDGYQLAKYRQNSKAIKLRDVLRLVHTKPKDKEQSKLFKELIDGTITPPDTWETALMTGKDKKATFERLISESKLGALAFLRNLRNMQEAKVSNIKDGLRNLKVKKILPFQFVQAAKYAPAFEDVIEEKMLEAVKDFEKLPGKTVLLVDVSGSMTGQVANKSDITCGDAAGGVAIMVRELCDEVVVYAFGNNLYPIPNRRGFALSDAVKPRQECTALRAAIQTVNELEDYDRIIVITDEQSNDGIGTPKNKGYVINVASYRNGVGYHNWTHIDGWSPAVVKYIAEFEK